MLLANIEDSDKMPHHVASDLGLHCLPMNHLQVPGKNRLSKKKKKNCSSKSNCFSYLRVNLGLCLPWK